VQLSASHFEQKPFVDGLMADFSHTTVVPYSKPSDEDV
jgi:hypothetical protein